MAMEPSTLGPLSGTQKMSLHKSADHLQEYVSKCMDCYQSCQQMILHCLQKGGEHAEANHIKLLQDCSAISAMTAKFMLRGSDYFNQLASICIDVCLDCAQDCENFDDVSMHECAKICRACAESIQGMQRPH